MSRNIDLYRPGVGLMIINKDKKIFLGKKHNKAKKYLQMPQGGIELGETPISAVMREMKEEIGTNNCKILLETKKWYFYNIPFKIQNQAYEKKYIGQMQKWFLIDFLGNDDEINVFNSEVAEFYEWEWVYLDNIIEYTIPFKRKLYISVIKEFRSYFDSQGR